MRYALAQLWVWLLQTFGLPGALLVITIAVLLGLSWLYTPACLWRLARQGRLLEQDVAELRERLAALSRHQQVDRLKTDKGRKRPRRRR